MHPGMLCIGLYDIEKMMAFSRNNSIAPLPYTKRV